MLKSLVVLKNQIPKNSLSAVNLEISNIIKHYKMRLQYLLIVSIFFLMGPGSFSQSVPNLGKDRHFGLPVSLYETQFKLDSILESLPKSFWKKKNIFGLDVNGISYQNWNAGGTDAISMLFNIHLKRIYQKKNIRWNNELISRYGINVQKKKKLEKTEDRLEINSTFGYRTDTVSNWFYSAKLNLKTQFTEGYEHPNRDNP